MSDIVLSFEQNQAINLKDKNIIISAQAGAGKTFVLVSRIIKKIIEEKVDITDLLIVTFTNKAAGEMKTRIIQDLQKELQKPNADQRYILDQKSKVINAQISTMHSFCINTIRTYFNKLNINPQFKIITDTSKKVMMADCMDQVFQDLYEIKEPLFLEYITNYSNRKDDSSIKNDVLNIYEQVMAQVDGFEWLNKIIESYSLQSIDKEQVDAKLNEIIIQTNNNQIKSNLQRLSIYLEEMQKLVASKLAISNFQSFVADHQIILKDIEFAWEAADIDNFYNILDQTEFKRIIGLKKAEKENQDYVSAYESFKEAREGFKNIVTSMKKNVQIFDKGFLEFVINENYKTLSAIKIILQKFYDLYQTKKKDKNVIDFTDAEHFTVELLKDQQVKDDLRDKFKYIFFDEYQDSNKLQNYIIEQIKRDNNLFFVGDIKQSIYKFRLADPSIFLDRYESYKEGRQYDQAIEFKENYRSRKGVLEFVNYIFDNLMTKSLGEIDYNDPAHRLVAKGSFKPIENYSPVEINYCINDIEKEDTYKEPFVSNPDMLREKGQALAIAKRISEMLDEGSNPRDFAILLRSKTIADNIIENLQAYNIPFFADITKVDFDNQEILEFINILRAIDNDKNDLVLMGALVSVLGEFTEDDLAQVRGVNKDVSFYHAFYNIDDRQDLDQVIKDKAQVYKDKIYRYRRIEKTMSLYDFAWYLIIDSGYLTYLLSKAQGKEKLDNIEAFISDMGEYEQASEPGLYNFLLHVEKIKSTNQGEIDPGVELSEQDNVVRIMTIHKSKGLQFKNVILANTEKKFNEMDLRKVYLLNNKLGLAFKTFDEESGKFIDNALVKAIKDKNERESLSEEIRLLYVALTRAIDKVMIFADVKDGYFTGLSDVYADQRTYIDWISSIVLRDEITDSFKLSNNIDFKSKNKFLRDNGVNISFNTYSNKQLVLEKIGKSADAVTLLNTNKVEHEAIPFLTYSYPFKEATLSQQKKTVSELASFNDNKSSDFRDYQKIVIEEEDLDFKIPKFIKEEDLSSTDYGTLNHLIFQLLPVKDYDEKILENELGKLLFEEYINEEDLKYIDREFVIAFYKSDLGQRLIKADLVRKEEAFTMLYQDHDQEILVDGQVDLFFVENNKIIIIDFKTNKNINPDQYKIQLDLYAQGLSEGLDKEVSEKNIYWTRHKKFTRF